MIRFSRQSLQPLRLWLIAAVAALLLTSVLEAGHLHGVFTPIDDQCTLCQHSVALDKPLSTPTQILIPVGPTSVAINLVQQFISKPRIHLAPIRAPPALLHTR